MILRESLRLLLLLLCKLFLGLLNHFLKLSNGGNRGRTESVFCDVAPNRSAIERILDLSAIHDERVLRWSNLGLGWGRGGGESAVTEGGVPCWAPMRMPESSAP